MPRKWGWLWEEERVASRDGEKQMLRGKWTDRNLPDPVNTLKPEVAGSANALI